MRKGTEAAVHLGEELLDQYLDQGLGPEERAVVEAHLAGCAQCRAALVALGELYGTFAALPPEPLRVDLTPRVLALIARPERVRRWWVAEVVLAVQAVLAVIAGAWLITQATGQVWLAWLSPQVPLQLLVSEWRPWPLPELGAPVSLPLALAPLQWSLIVLVGVILWAVVNRALLGAAGTPRRQQEGA